MRISDFFKETAVLPSRDLQLYASKCLQAYCKAKSIQHRSVDELIAHLNNYPERDNLVDWERKGAGLSLNGRGDDMPQELALLISPQEAEEFSYVVDRAVEVGIADMYGAPTERPVKFLGEIALILHRNNIDLP
ncbi:hypothetical protein [Pseudomonas purpurea]|uniref:hypothetical protein n=1 Tax=Pseudomonas purpurea TaxID=3136737 RepID=UPI0032650336